MNIFSRAWASASVRTAPLYFKIRSWWPVWFYVINRTRVRAFNEKRNTLTVVQERIVSDLRRDGIAVARMDELFPGADMLAQFRQYTQERIAAAERKTYKSFLKNLWDAVPAVDLDNPFVPMALSDGVLGAVNEYMGMFSYFFYLTLNVTTPVPAGSDAVFSQRWHGDPEDKKMCKVFLYVNDVAEGSGPFIYVSGTQWGGRWRHLFREQPPHGFLPPSEPIDTLIPPSDIKRYTGRAGTIIFCDTSGYHRGGYATEQERIMLTLGYCSAASAYPLRIRFDESLPAQVAKQGFSRAARHALTFSRGSLTQYFFKKVKPNFKYGAE